MGGLDEVFGAALCGIIVDSWVFGLICVLSYQYFVNFPKDGLGTKLLVAFTWLLQAFHLVVVSKMIYYYLVTSFGIANNLSFSTWEWSLYLGLSVSTIRLVCNSMFIMEFKSLAAFSVQSFYARRIYIITQSYILWGIISVFAFCQLGFGLATMSEAFHIVVFAKFIPVGWVSVTWLSFSAACDLIIAVIQVLYLHSQRTGIRTTNRIINTLILYVMSTGLLTSIVAILELTTFATLGFNFTHVFLSFPMGAIYTVSFLANLDARRTVRAVTSVSVVHEESMPISIAFKRAVQTRTDRSSTIGGTTQNELHEDQSFQLTGKAPSVE